VTLSPSQLEILQAIDRSIQVHGYAPTVQELRAELGHESPTYVLHQIGRLAELGYIDREVATWRGLRVTELGAQVITEGVDSLSYRVLRAVQLLVERMGHGPSLREIQDEASLNYSQVRKCMGRLESAGMVARPLPTWRSMSVTPRGRDALERVAERGSEPA
jgi:RIO-like serine/threonine protein kinase